MPFFSTAYVDLCAGGANAMGGRKWPLLLVLTALGTGGAYRDTRSAEVNPVWDDELQHDMSNMQRGVEEETPVPECPHSCDSHAVLDKGSQEACKLKGTLSPNCSDLSGITVFLDQTNTEQNFTVFLRIFYIQLIFLCSVWVTQHV